MTERERFESWISGEPFSREITRYPNDPEKYAWPGQYKCAGTQVAWLAWQESQERSEEPGAAVNHTPGPWEHNGNAVHKRSSPHFAACIAICEGEQRHANARLIAAAPDLLEVIKAALRIKDLWAPSDNESPEFTEECRALELMLKGFQAAVKKAEKHG